MIELSEIKALRELGHNIDTLITLLEKKQSMKMQNRHWFVFQDGRNVCEFCGCPYAFATSDSICNPNPPASPAQTQPPSARKKL